MELQETPCFIPVIARLDGLDRQIRLLEEKRTLPRRDFGAAEGENECKTLSSALEEVQHKGTLMERLAILEKRVLELSLEFDEGHMSRSSSSTVQGPEMIGKKDSQLSIHKREDGSGDAINTQEMEDPATIHAQERASPAELGTVKETTASCRSRSRRQKKKSQKKWPWLFRHTC